MNYQKFNYIIFTYFIKSHCHCIYVIIFILKSLTFPPKPLLFSFSSIYICMYVKTNRYLQFNSQTISRPYFMFHFWYLRMTSGWILRCNEGTGFKHHLLTKKKIEMVICGLMKKVGSFKSPNIKCHVLSSCPLK